MKVKTSELTGAALDWAVAKCEGWSEEGLQYIAEGDRFPEHDFSTNWALGGPIIEREGINLNFMQFDVPPYWTAHIRHTDKVRFGSVGPTPLISAMRCFVASNLGDTVDVPNELME